MTKNLVLGPILDCFGPISVLKTFLWVLPQLDVIHYCKLSLYAIWTKTNEPNLGKWQKKPSFRPDFDPNLGFKNFYHIFYLYYMLDIVASYHCEQF